MTGDPVEPSPAATPNEAAPTILTAIVGELIGDLRTSLAARFDVAEVEARRAGATLLRAIAAACAVIGLCLTAWWAVWAALLTLAVELGVSWTGALAGAAVSNLALAGCAFFFARNWIRGIGMPHTRRLFVEPGSSRRSDAQQLETGHAA